jgi:hypothetical protein
LAGLFRWPVGWSSFDDPGAMACDPARAVFQTIIAVNRSGIDFFVIIIIFGIR